MEKLMASIKEMHEGFSELERSKTVSVIVMSGPPHMLLMLAFFVLIKLYNL